MYVAAACHGGGVITVAEVRGFPFLRWQNKKLTRHLSQFRLRVCDERGSRAKRDRCRLAVTTTPTSGFRIVNRYHPPRYKTANLGGRPVRLRLKKPQAQVLQANAGEASPASGKRVKEDPCGRPTRPRARHPQRMSSQRRPARLSQSQSFAVIDHHDEVSSALCKYSCGDCCHRARRARSRAVRVLLPSCAWPCRVPCGLSCGDKNVRA